MIKVSYPKIEKRPIPGYEGKYSASSDGHIWSHINNQYLAEFENNTGYLRVGLGQGDGSQKKELVERLVASAFLDNPDPEHLKDVDHKNQDTLDNRVDNLRWIDKSGNMCNTEKVKPVVDMVGAYEYHSITEASRKTGVDYAEITRQVKEAEKNRTSRKKQNRNIRFKYSEDIGIREIHKLMDIHYKEKYGIIFNHERPYVSYYSKNSIPEYGFCQRFFSDNIIYPISFLKNRKERKAKQVNNYIIMTEGEFALIQRIFKICKVKEAFAEYKDAQKDFKWYYERIEKFVNDMSDGNVIDDKAIANEFKYLLVPSEGKSFKLIAKLDISESKPLKLTELNIKESPCSIKNLKL